MIGRRINVGFYVEYIFLPPKNLRKGLCIVYTNRPYYPAYSNLSSNRAPVRRMGDLTKMCQLIATHLSIRDVYSWGVRSLKVVVLGE